MFWPIRLKNYKRRNSVSGNIQNTNNRTGPPKVNVHKRRLSEPTTNMEKGNAVKTQEMNKIQLDSSTNIYFSNEIEIKVSETKKNIKIKQNNITDNVVVIGNNIIYLVWFMTNQAGYI